MRNIIVKLSLLMTLISCGDSPLMNHARASQSPLQGNPAPQDPSCPLKFVDMGYCASVEWTQGPQIRDSKFKLRIWNTNAGTAAGPYVDTGAPPTVKPWMIMGNGMEHGSNRPSTVGALAPGVYEAGVYFTMIGAWQLHVTLSDGRGRSETKIFMAEIE